MGNRCEPTGAQPVCTHRSLRVREATPRPAKPKQELPHQNDILPAVNDGVSPSALGVGLAIAPLKTVRGTPVRRTGAIPPACARCLGLCAKRESRAECGVFCVPRDAVSPCNVHPRRPRGSRGMPPVADFSASEHGSCHRPASPLCHAGDAHTGEVRILVAVFPRPRDALSGTVWYSSSCGRTSIQPPTFAQ